MTNPSTYYAVLLVLVLGAGCGGGEKEKPQSPSQSENTQQEENQNTNEVANRLFDEAMQLIRDGEVAGADFHTVDFYEKALDKIRKIVKEHPESDIGRKVMSNQKLFMGKSLAQFESHVKEVRERDREFDVTLPTNSSGKTLSTAPKLIVINVKQDGSYKMGDKEMELDQIRIKLKEEVQKNPDQKVLVRGDGDALHKHVAAAVAAAKGAGVKEAHIGYKAEPNE